MTPSLRKSFPAHAAGRPMLSFARPALAASPCWDAHQVVCLVKKQHRRFPAGHVAAPECRQQSMLLHRGAPLHVGDGAPQLGVDKIVVRHEGDLGGLRGQVQLDRHDDGSARGQLPCDAAMRAGSHNQRVSHLGTLAGQEVRARPAPGGTANLVHVFDVEGLVVIGAARVAFHCTVVRARARGHSGAAREVLGGAAELRNILVHAHLGARAKHAHARPVARLA